MNNSRRKQALKEAREARLRRNGYSRATRKDFVFIIIGTILTFSFLGKVTQYTTDRVPPTVVAQSTVNGISVSPTPVKVAENWDEFIKSAEKIAPIYNFPLKLLIAQAAHESNRGLSEFARERNNYFGMCAYDFDPDQACYYENQEQGMIAYIINIRETFPEAWEQRDNPEQLLRLLIRNSHGLKYATDPQYIEKVMNTPEWRNY